MTKITEEPTVIIPDEHVAIVARRSEWAGLLCELRESKRFKRSLQENPETMEAAESFAFSPVCLVDKIAVSVVDTQLRIEKGITPNLRTVKVLKSENIMRSAWEPLL